MENRASLFHSVVGAFALLAASMASVGCASNSLAPPVITSLNPSSATAGGPSFTLKVVGTSFLSTDVVLWNGAALATQPVSSTELDAQVPGSLIQSAVEAKAALRFPSASQSHPQVTPDQSGGGDTADVTVFRKPPGSVESNPMTFTITSGVPDFSISASPSSQTVTAGGTAPYTATVGALNGFTGTVDLSVSGLPSGGTGSFTPTSVVGSGTSMLTVGTASSTSAGTYTLTITGTSGSLTHSTTFTLDVNAAATPDFSISASPSSQTTTAGGTAPYTATVGALNGFTGTVDLSVSGLPSGGTGSFTPTSVVGSGTSMLTVSTASNTSAGTYTLTITGTSGTLIHSTTVTLDVNAAATPDFSISASPSSQTTTAPGTAPYTATVGALNGFTGTVDLSVSGLPSGGTGSFTPTSVVGSGTSMLTVSTASSTSAGTYTLTITGASGSLTHSTTVTLVVN